MVSSKLRPSRWTRSTVFLAVGAYAFWARGVFAQSGFYDTSQDDNYGELLQILAIVLGVLIIYCIPGIVAFFRGHPNRWPILLINIVFGGTILGWFGALIWAMQAVHKSEIGSDGGESGLNLFVNDPLSVKMDPGLVARSSVDQDLAIDQINRLKKLLDQGAITQAEYDKLRKPWVDVLVK